MELSRRSDLHPALRALLVAKQAPTVSTHARAEAVPSVTAAPRLIAPQASAEVRDARSLIAASSRRIESRTTYGETVERKRAVVSRTQRVREKHLTDVETEVVALANGMRWALRGPSPPATSEMLPGGPLHEKVNTLLAFLASKVEM